MRFGFNLANVSVLSPRANTNFTIDSLGIHGLNVGGPSGRPLRPDEQGFPVINISGYMGMGDDQAASNLDNSRTFQMVDNLPGSAAATRSNSAVDIRRLMDDATTNNWPFGNIAFTGDITGNAAADYMLGFPRTTLTPEGVPISKITAMALRGVRAGRLESNPQSHVESGAAVRLLRAAARDQCRDAHASLRSRPGRSGAMAGSRTR